MKWTVKFVKVRNGDVIEWGDTANAGVRSGWNFEDSRHKFLGFKSGPGPRAEGWLVFLVQEGKGQRPHRVRGRSAA